MLAEWLALIAGEDHNGIIQPAHATQSVEEDSQPSVHQRHGPGVGPP